MASNRANNSSTAIYDEVDYKVMLDVPYELDQRSLAQMQKLERGLGYILENLHNNDMTLEEVAAHAGYSPGYFKALFAQHFEAPFERFVTQLRMRQAARDIYDEHFPKDIAARYGYANPASFSKAFRREIGISPRQFYKGNYAVPDMPLRSNFDGARIRLDYTVERAFILLGNTAPPPRGVQTFLMDALALPFTGKYPQFGSAIRTTGATRDGRGERGGHGDGKDSAAYEDPTLREGLGELEGRCVHDDFVGLWNYRAEAGMEYVFGPVEERLDAISVLDAQPRENEDGTLRIVVQGGRYAVFSYERPEDDRAIPLMQRMLSRYVFQEWIPMNRKATNTMGYTYERFTPERVYLYLPIAYGMDYGSELRKLAWGVEEWAFRIDELIGVDLSAEVLADLAGYSTKNYIDVFSMYYGITPSVYIRRRRLYLAEERLRQALGKDAELAEVAVERLDAIVREYRFTSYEQFLRIREKEIGSTRARSLQESERHVDGAADWVAHLAGSGASTDLPNPVVTPVADDDPSKGRLVDLRAYYEFNKERVVFSVYRLNSFELLEYSIEESRERRQPQDLTARVLYWFTSQFPGSERFAPFFASDGAKVFIWAQDASGGRESAAGDVSDSCESADDDLISRYYVAYVLREDLSVEDRAALDGALAGSGVRLETVPGGCYAVFSTVDDLESYSLNDAFLLLTRCAFGGWIKDNRWRVDFSRRTFVAWRRCRLLFFVPTVG